MSRLENLHQCCESVILNGIPGDFIETGVWRGGACIFMRGLLKAHGSLKKVYACDSFCGLPEPDVENYPDDSGDNHHTFDYMKVSLEEVKENFASYGLLDDQVVFVPGWFKDTLHTIDAEFSVVRLDGDMYESTWQALEALYPRLSVGGYLIVDDYRAVYGCTRAVDDYREKMGIEDTINEIDGYGVYWKKT
jgi:hypothetical protein